MRVGVAGLGLMGSAIAIRLVNTGYAVSVYNRSSSKSNRFSKSAIVASSPKELGNNCDLVITVVTDFNAVKVVLLGKDGVTESTNRRSEERRVGQECDDRLR